MTNARAYNEIVCRKGSTEQYHKVKSLPIYMCT